MESTVNYIISSLLGVLLMIIAYIAKDTRESLKEIEKEFNEFRFDVANVYAKKTEVTTVVDSVDKLRDYLEKKLDRMEGKIDDHKK